MEITIRDALSAAAFILAAVGFIPYISSTLRGTTKPSKASWVIWLALTALTAGGMYDAGTLNAQIVMYVVGDVFVVMLAFKYGQPGWSALDKFCLVGAALGIVLWLATSDPLYAIVIGLFVTFIGSVPTFVKTWHHPEQESAWAWPITTLASAAQSLAIPAWTVEAAAQPLTYLGIQGYMCVLIFLRPKRLLERIA